MAQHDIETWPIAWILASDYATLQAMMQAPHQLPATYEQWHSDVERRISALRWKGVVPNLIIVRPGQFLDFCRDNNLDRDPRSCEAYAASYGDVETFELSEIVIDPSCFPADIRHAVH